jgi:hypothetical protein
MHRWRSWCARARRWEAVDELAPEAHVTLRGDGPVEAQPADLLALLDRRLGRLGARREPGSDEQQAGDVLETPPAHDSGRSLAAWRPS